MYGSGRVGGNIESIFTKHTQVSTIWGSIIWVAVKELKLSYYIGENLLFTIYTHYGNLIEVP